MSGVIALMVAGVLPLPGVRGADVLTMVVALAIAAIAAAAISLVWPTTLRPWSRSPVAALPLFLAAALMPSGTAELVVLIPGVACLVALAHAEVRSAEHSAAPVPVSAPTALRAGTVVVVAAVGLALALPWALDAAPALSNRLPAGFAGAQPQASSSGAPEMDLRARGDLPKTPLFVVGTDSPNLWRTQVLSTFDGDRWVARNVEPVFSDGASRVTTLALPGDAGRFGAGTGTFDVEALPAGLGSPVIAPGRPIAVSGGGELIVDAGGKVWLNLVNFQDSPRYSVTAELSSVAPSPAPDGAGLDAPPAGEQWEQLPQLPESVLAVANSLRRSDAASTARAIEDHLVEVTRYDLDAPVPDAGQDVTEEFLLGSQRGFCEHYASASAVLLRANGIPARVVVGYSRNTSDATGRIRASDAHAWTEYWVPGAGWATLDPTARSQLAEPSLVDRWPVIAGVAAALTALALGVVWMLRRRSGPTPLGSGAMPTGRQPRDAFVRLERRSALRGRGRARGQSVRTFAARVLPGGPASWRAIEVVEQDIYGDKRPASDDAAAAVDLMDRTAL
jgi:hypothetical protein